MCTPLYRQHEPDTSFKREHGISGEDSSRDTEFAGIVADNPQQKITLKAF
jgi:hypothetical protein